jgi:hypothetical protein
MSWKIIVLVAFLCVTFVRFVKAKMENPTNPSGYLTAEYSSRMGVEPPLR